MRGSSPASSSATPMPVRYPLCRERGPVPRAPGGATLGSGDDVRAATGSTAEANRREIHRLHPQRGWAACVYWPFHFEILLKQKSFSEGECLQAKGSQHVWLERIAKAGGSNDQISAQVCDAGNVP